MDDCNNGFVTGTRKIFVAILMSFLISVVFCTQNVLANPVGGQVAVGNATISSPSNDTVQINQASDKSVINWQSFNIAPNEKTQFQQPSASSITLNRIDPSQGVSQIFGQLSANGQVILINQAGIYFGPSARVDVGGIVASTSDISNENFMLGKYIFDSPSEYSGSVINKGTIKAGRSGLIGLVGTAVQNDGLIVANTGTVVLASGRKFTLDFNGDGLINFAIDEPATSVGVDQNRKSLQSSISNTGRIIANGGKIIVSANTVKAVLRNTINMTGILVANTAQQKNGVIILSADNGTVRVSGKIHASGKHFSQKGGNIEILGDKIILAKKAKIDVSGDAGGGKVLIGGDYQGKNPDVLNATSTYIGKSVKINADALYSGNGGKVIVWSDENTQFYGSISAKGGSQSGNGGFVETSGKNMLDVYQSKVIASAPFGQSGTWLLDPRNVVIDNTTTTCTSPSCFSGSNPDIYTPDSNTSHVSVSDILNALETGTSVTITTGTTGTQAGNITVNAAINKTLGITPVTLTLDSSNGGGTITVSNPIASTSGTLGVSLLSGNAITITSNIITNGGDFLANAQNAVTLGNGQGTTPGIIDAGNGKISIRSNQDAAGGQDFTMNSNSSISSTNNTASAIGIIVNTPSGGAGQASLRDITAGADGKIIISTDGTLGTETGNTTGSNIILSAENTLAGGDILLTTPGAVTFNGVINTAGTVSIFADTNSSTSNFSMGAGSSITTTDASADAVKINVNTALGGKGAAVLRDITTGNGGTITVKTDTGGNITGGDITQPTGTLNSGTTGAIILSNPNVTGRNIGTSAANIQVLTETLNLTTGSGGAFITNLSTGTLNLSDINMSGAFDLVSTNSSVIFESGALAIGGITTINAGATQNIFLNSTGNDFSTLEITNANTVILQDSNALDIGATTINGDLNVTTGGNITNSAGISVAGVATFSAGSNDITLNNSSNDFNTVGITNANNVTFHDANSFNFENSVISGNMNLTAAGNITQSSGSSLTINGMNSTATFNAGSGNNIILKSPNNDFTSIVVNSGNNTSFDDANALQFGAATSTISGTLDVIIGGDLTQLDGALIVTGLTTLNSGINNITLANSTNNFSTVKIENANNATLRDTTNLDIGTSNIANTLTLTADDGITQSGAITVPNLIATTQKNSFSSITLDNVNNDVSTINLRTLNGAGTANSSGVVTFSNSRGFNVASIGTTSNINLISLGEITDSGNISGATLTTTSVSGTSLDFGHNITGLNATNTVSGNIKLINTGNLTVSGINQAGNGDIDISNTGTVAISGNIDMNSGNGSIGIHTTNALTLNSLINAGAGTVLLEANTGSAGGNFTMNSGSSITTTNVTSSAVIININNALGGSSTAALGDIVTGSGGAITVRTNTGNNSTGGDITQVNGTLNSGNTGIVTLITPNSVSNNIGTGVSPIKIIAGELNASSGNSGIFITNTAANTLSVKTLEAFRSDNNAKGSAQIISNGIIQQTAVSNPINVATLTIKTLNDLGANINFNNSNNFASSINLSSKNISDTANAAGNILYKNSASINVAGLTTVNNADLIANGSIADSGVITVGGIFTTSSVGGTVLNNSNQINGVNATNSGSGNITFSGNAIPLTITGLNQNGGGAVNFTNTSDLTLANGTSFNTHGGELTLTVSSGALTLSDSAMIDSGNANINLNLKDINLSSSSSINSGSGDISIIQNTTGGSIGIGNAVGTLSINGAELQTLTANDLMIFAPSDGQIIVDGVSTANSNNIQNIITLNATAGTLGSVIFQNNPSTFRALTVNSDSGITVSNNTELTSSLGDLVMESNSITLNSDLTSAGSLTLSAASDGIMLNSSVTLTGNDITFNDVVNGANNLTLNAGSSGDITFNGNVGNTARIGALNIINVNNLINNGLINAASYTQYAGNTINIGSNGLSLTGNANIVGATFDGAVNVAGLSLNVSFANLNGFVGGSSGQAAIGKIINLNTITSGTHFFDGIDMYSKPIPPAPATPSIPSSILSEVPQSIFSYLYSIPEVLPQDSLNINNNFDAQEKNNGNALTELNSGNKNCVSLGVGVVMCFGS